MKFEDFLERATQIVAEHRAQYAGEYYMKGGILGTVEKFAGPLLDVAAVATGNPELIPLAQTIGGTISGVSQGESFGKALGQGAIGGAEALGGQELAGAFGLGQGNTLLNNSLGIDISPAATGLPNIGAGIDSALGTSIFSSGSGTATDPGAITSGPYAPAPGTTPVTSASGPLPWSAGGTGAGGVSPAGSPGLPGPVAAPAGAGVAAGQSDILSNYTPGGNAVDLVQQFNQTSPTSSFDQMINSNFGGGTGPGLPAVSGGVNLSSGVAAPAANTNTGLNFLQHPFSDNNFGKFLAANPGSVLSAGGIIKDLITGNKPVTGEGALKTQASQLGQQGQQLESYLQSGQLPPGLQAGINQAVQAEKASIRSQYATKGMSGSSAEAADLAAADQRAQAQAAEYAMNLLNTGINETGLSSQLYQALMNNALQQDNQLGNAINAFINAAGGGSGNEKTIKLTA